MNDDVRALLQEAHDKLGEGKHSNFGFRNYQGKVSLRDLSMFQSPIFGIGTTEREAVLDALHRGKNNVYAHVLGFDGAYSEELVKALKKATFGHEESIVALPSKKAIAIQSSVPFNEVVSMVKRAGIKEKLKTIVFV